MLFSLYSLPTSSPAPTGYTQLRFPTPFRQVTSAARQALRRAVLEADPRLVEALFLCEVRRTSWNVCSRPVKLRSVKLNECFMLEADPRLVEALLCCEAEPLSSQP